jgi:hypothetical protein
MAYFYLEHEMKEDLEDGLHKVNIVRIKKNFKPNGVQNSSTRGGTTGHNIRTP